MPNIDKNDKKAVLKALDQPTLTNGPNLQKFELSFFFEVYLPIQNLIDVCIKQALNSN